MVFSRVFSLSSSQSVRRLSSARLALSQSHKIRLVYNLQSSFLSHSFTKNWPSSNWLWRDVKETQKHRNELKKDRPYGKHMENLLLLIRYLLFLLLFFNMVHRPSYTLLHSGHRNGFLLSSAHYIRDWLTQASKPLFFATSLYCLVKICFWRLTLSAADGNVR